MSGRLQLALEAVRRHYIDYGCSPSFRELGEAIGVPPQRVSAIVRELVGIGAIGFTAGMARSITLNDPLEMLSTSQLLLALQARGLLVKVIPAAQAMDVLADIYAPPRSAIVLPAEIVTEMELPERYENALPRRSIQR